VKQGGSQLAEADFDIAAPHAASLVESLRAFGYELPTALADLVDNSITASAKTIWVDFHWDGESSVITLTDDGNGMTESSSALSTFSNKYKNAPTRTPFAGIAVSRYLPLFYQLLG
jgi:hypothetical protein